MKKEDLSFSGKLHKTNNSDESNTSDTNYHKVKESSTTFSFGKLKYSTRKKCSI